MILIIIIYLQAAYILNILKNSMKKIILILDSLINNSSIVVKSKLYGRSKLSIKSLTSLWKGAELQEREIWDLMGIYFDDHPNMKRILLWEGFEGHPLRKDFIK